MLVFIYDKTFEGLLTAVFDAYNRKAFPHKLLAEGDLLPLFTEETYQVLTDLKKSTRVWRGLQRKLSHPVCNMLMCVWLSEIPQSDELLFRYIQKVFDASYAIETNFADDDVLQVKKIAYKVHHESLHLIQFVRFQKAADGIFFAPVAPLYNSLPLTLHYFTDRFADQRWLIYDLNRKYGYYYDLKRASEVTLADDTHLLSGKLDDACMAEDETLFQEFWRGYVKALTIKERINLKLQRQHMPRRFWKYLTEKQER